MADEKYYFYRKTIQPDDYDYYHHAKGIAGFRQPKPYDLILHGTLADLEEYLKHYKPARIAKLAKGRTYGVKF